MKNNNIRKYIGYFSLILIAMTYIMYHFYHVSAGNVLRSRMIQLFLLIIVLVMSISLCIVYFIRHKEIEKQFFIIAIIWGVLFSLVIPPMQAPDENLHAYRAYDLAKGHIFYTGNEDSMMLPAGIKQYEENIRFEEQRYNWWVQLDFREYLKSINTDLQKDNLIKYEAGATSAYVSIAYIPQAIGIFIGDALNLPPYFVLNLGRLFNLLTWVSICYFALKIMPIRKSLFMLLMLLPVSLQQACSLSPDALLNSCSFFMISYILFLKFKKDKVQYVDYILLAGLTIVIGAIKLPYIFISLLLFIIPKDKFRFKNISKSVLMFAIIFINLLVMIGWAKLSTPKVNQNQQVIEVENDQDENIQQEETSQTEVVKSASYVETINTIIKSPIEFMEKTLDTIKINYDFYKMSFVAYFGWLDTKSPMIFVNLWFVILLIFMIIPENTSYSFKKIERALLLAIPVAMYLGLCAVIVKWNGGEFKSLVSFEGLQGRYFYPFIMSLFLLFHNNKSKFKLSDDNIVVNNYRNLFLILSLAVSATIMIGRFYIGY